MSEKPTGVFVRLPLSEEQRMTANEAPYKKDRKGSALEASILSIGTPVTGGDLEVRGYEYEIRPQGCTIFTHEVGRSIRNGAVAVGAIAYRNIVPLVRQSDHQAQIAALETEVVRLREYLDASKRKNFNAGYLIACCNIYNMHNEEGIAADILREAGIAEAEVKALDLNEYDADALAVIRSAVNDDPILKGGAA